MITIKGLSTWVINTPVFGKGRHMYMLQTGVSHSLHCHGLMHNIILGKHHTILTFIRAKFLEELQ